MQRNRWTLANVMGIAGLLLAGFAILSSLQDIRRYARIVRM